MTFSPTLVALLCLWTRVSGHGNSSPPYRVLVHLTDLHLSVHEPLLPFGTIRADLRTFTEQVLNPIESDLVIITGDLVDAKDFFGAGKQHEEEAIAYAAFEESISPNTAVLTVPGNHDRFDTGPSLANSRLAVRALMKDGRVVKTDDMVTNECPAAIMLGLDVSTLVGLRSPANFLAVTSDDDILRIKEDMRDFDAMIAKARCARDPLVISYGHYPLSIYSTSHVVGPLGALSHAFGSINCLDHPITNLIARTANVYLSGHLHSLFGRLHRTHDAPRKSSSTDADLDVAHRLTELESAAWKDDRRFRILVVDARNQEDEVPACLSFADYNFLTPSSPRLRANYRNDLEQRRQEGWQASFDERGWGITSDGGFSVDGTMVILTWPPDASYGLCAAKDSVHPTHDVRALVLAHSSERPLSVTAHITLPGGRPLGSVPLKLDGEWGGNAQRSFVGTFDANILKLLASEPIYHVRVEVHDDGGSLVDKGCSHHSEDDDTATRPMSHDSATDHHTRIIAASPTRAVTTDGTTVALDQNFVEFITLYVNWANLAHRIYLLMILALLGVLISVRQSRVIMGYVAYQLVGPLYAGQLLSRSWPFVAFHHGVFGYIDGKGWISVPTADTLLVAAMHMTLCLIPMTAWVVMLDGTGGARRSSSSSHSSRCAVTSARKRVFKWGSLGLIVFLNAKLLWVKLAKLNGLLSLLSPITVGIPIFLLRSGQYSPRRTKES